MATPLDEINDKSLFDGIEIGIGTWSWGDRLFWGYGQGYGIDDIRMVFNAAVSAGITFFDTAEAYGSGRSESILGELIPTSSQKIVIGTKFMPFPWRLSHRSLHKALKNSLKRLNLAKVDLYQLHMAWPPLTIETWMEAMSQAFQDGLISAVGISNCDRGLMQRACDALSHTGIKLASNQVEYNLLNRKVEKNGLLKHCQETGIKLIAYSPLAQGVLTGKYNPENLPTGIRRGRFSRKYLEQIQPLIRLLKQIGLARGGKTPAQVALNWVIKKGALPIPGAKTIQQFEENFGANGWSLTEEEVSLLDQASDRIIDNDKKRS